MVRDAQLPRAAGTADQDLDRVDVLALNKEPRTSDRIGDRLRAVANEDGALVVRQVNRHSLAGPQLKRRVWRIGRLASVTEHHDSQDDGGRYVARCLREGEWV